MILTVTVTDTAAISLRFSIEVFKGDPCGSLARGIRIVHHNIISMEWDCCVWKNSNSIQSAYKIHCKSHIQLLPFYYMYYVENRYAEQKDSLWRGSDTSVTHNSSMGKIDKCQCCYVVHIKQLCYSMCNNNSIAIRYH